MDEFETLEALDAEIAKARTALIGMEARRKALLSAKWGVKAGDAVRGTSGTHKGKLGVVHAVRFWDQGRPWIEARLQKKDGTIGEAVRHLYGNWERAGFAP